ncbi:hypothetical protein ACWPMX_04385 [Tsuneonella sp. HG094]
MTFLILTLSAVVLYLGAGPYFIFRGRIFLGCLVMALASITPVAAEVWFTDSEIPGPALLAVVLLPFPVLIAIGRTIYLLFGLARSAAVRNKGLN